jgi:hypothetical protein
MATEMAKAETGTVWMPVVLGSLISGVASGVVGYFLGKRDKPCACKTGGGNGNGGNGNGGNGNGGNGNGGKVKG